MSDIEKFMPVDESLEILQVFCGPMRGRFNVEELRRSVKTILFYFDILESFNTVSLNEVAKQRVADILAYEDENSYCLEYSEYSNKKNLYPFKVESLERSVRLSLQDMVHEERGQNKWQIIFIGTFEECYHKRILYEKKVIKPNGYIGEQETVNHE